MDKHLIDPNARFSSGSPALPAARRAGHNTTLHQG
jgi:hypothetical protein